MKSFHIDCELDYDIAHETVFVFNLAVPTTGRQRVLAETFASAPALVIDEFADATGMNRFLRLSAPSGPLSVRYLATVDVDAPASDALAPESPLAELPGPTMPYVVASRYCEADQVFALAARKFGQLPPGYGRVQAICEWIRDNIDYQVGTSSPVSTARDVLANRAGVCRDFAHVAIALCRALNIPARFVTGYARYRDPPADFHAVFEAYLGGQWHLFDPTELSPLDEFVRIGTGRDASEVAFATFFGSARLRRLSPLIEPAVASKELVALQTPESGVRLPD
jgi:transglutaminase-like putative cysteine protease